MPSQSLVINLAISADDFVLLYQGRASEVVATATNGQTVRFPASILRPHVLHDGVQGQFRLSFDGARRFVSIERL